MYIIPKENESYEEYINRILNSRENKKDIEKYMEYHHIIPKGWGGEKTSENMIWLYPEEHYYAHKLLALENPDDYVAVSAWHKMQNPVEANQQRYYIISAEDFGEARRLFSKLHSQKMTGEGNPNYGKKFTEERINKIKQSYLDGRHDSACRKVKNIETGKIFKSCQAAIDWCGLTSRSAISKAASGKRKSAGKHPETGEPLHWEYVE